MGWEGAALPGAYLNQLFQTQAEQGFFSAEDCSLWTWAALGVNRFWKMDRVLGAELDQ